MNRVEANTRRSMIGADVGPYTIVEELGSGGMGTVYKAVDRALDRAVALKILFDLEDPENINRFRREAKALGKLRHPNTIQIYWVGEIEGYPCFAMEYCEGSVSVYDLLKGRGFLPVDAAVDTIIQAARGLEAAREAGVVHRDIKPNNLLVADDGTIKIADFGLAKLTHDANNELTQSGIIMGTPYYMSPEQGQGEAIDHRADQYSLGASFFHMVTGFTPYEAENPVSLIIKHVREPIPNMQEMRPSVPDTVRRIIEKMMSKNVTERYQSYDELIEDLERYTEGAEPVHATPQKKKRAVPSLKLPVWLYVMGGIAIGTGVMYGVSQWRQGTPNAGVTPTQGAATATATVAAASPLSSPVTGATVTVPGVDPTSDLGMLIAQLGDEDTATRTRSAVILGRNKEKRALLPLIRMVESDPDPSVQARAAWALGEIGSQEATPALLRVINHDDSRIATAAVDAVGGLQDIRAVKPLGRVAKDHSDPTVRRKAATARDRLFSAPDGTEEWWRARFNELRTRVAEAEEEIRKLTQASTYYEERYGWSPSTDTRAMDSEEQEVFTTVYSAARAERARAERRKKNAQSELRRLRFKADAQGVPAEWRS